MVFLDEDSEEIPAAHVRLFRREAIDQMTSDDFKYLLRFTNKIQREKLPQLWTEDKERAKSYIFKITSFAPEPEAIEKLKQIILRDKNRLVNIQLNLMHLKSRSYYMRLFAEDKDDKMDRISVALEPKPIIDFLRNKNVHDYEPMIERVQYYLNQRQVADAACQMLRSLPYCSDADGSDRKLGEWYYDFLDACLTHGYTRFFPRFIDPEYAEDLRNFRASIEVESRRHIIIDDDLVDHEESYPQEPRNQADYQEFRQLTSDVDYEPIEYQLRPYQIELVAHANNGRNTIICAPTGCGKTLVATDIILKHLRAMRREKRIGRAVLFVPTVPLVEQQTIELLRYMAGEFWVDGFSGAENISDRAGNFLVSDVCVVTPQIVINMMNSILRHEKIYFSDMTLMIFDECHNCTEQHPYKILMDMLEESGLKNKPQIVGLTASLGVGQTSWDMLACRDHMLKMCSSLLADSISTVRHQLENLKSHVMPPVDKIERAKRPKDDEFPSLIKETMIKIQERMKPLLDKLLENQLIPLKKEDIHFPDLRFGAKYQQVVGSLRRSLQRLSDHEMRLFLVRSADHLAHYFHSLSIGDLLPNKFALDYLESKMSMYAPSTENANDVNNILMEYYESIANRLRKLAREEVAEEKELLQKLYNIILTQYTEKPESRTLIFVATRACARSLSEHLSIYLKECRKLKMFYGRQSQVGYMTSTNQSAGAGGQSGEQQRMMRDRFKRGEIKILVVTSVADEGINIMECNLIVKYNSVGSERTLIQRRGRARDKDSKAILLALDTNVEQQEFDNMKKEALMLACINDLQSIQDEALQKMIADKTRSLKELVEEKRQRVAERRDMLSTRKYQLNCRACNSKICDSMDVRSVSNSFYVCVDAMVWTRSRNEIIKRPSKDGLTTKCARWICIRCGEEWGNVVKFSNVFLPSLAVKAFVMERTDTKENMANNTVKKGGWNQIQTEYFNIDPIRAKNIRDMLYAFTRLPQEEQDKLEQQEIVATELFKEKWREQPEKKMKQQILLEE